MGSCQSSPKDGSVSPTAGKNDIQKTTVPGTKVPLKMTTDAPTSQELSHQHQHEETDATSDGSDRENRAPISVSDGTKAKNPLVTPRESKSGQHSKGRRKRIKPGYSSGGSSEYSSDETAEAHQHLLDWKNELGADGDLCKGVVRIEVS
jgi:hypothetical protein